MPRKKQAGRQAEKKKAANADKKTTWARKKQGEGSHDGHGVVVEDRGDVFRGKLVGGIADEQTCLADRTVADDDAPAEGGKRVSTRAGACAGRMWRAFAYLIVATTMVKTGHS